MEKREKRYIKDRRQKKVGVKGIMSAENYRSMPTPPTVRPVRHSNQRCCSTSRPPPKLPLSLTSMFDPQHFHLQTLFGNPIFDVPSQFSTPDLNLTFFCPNSPLSHRN
uniref:Uncharacterized protein n=1 Tax=Romanomermis culicivorax TaxID=13658 RepID=A0A915IWD0_ROMCU